LGGGSADAAFFIKSINNYFELKMTTDEMLQIASSLGSDCSFFISNQTSFATQKGEILESFNLNLIGYNICIIHPKIHVNTAWAYSKIKPLAPNKSIKEILIQPIETWKNELINDFEKPVFESHPEIESIKMKLYEQGAIYASMSGSGSAVFGLFKNEIPNFSLNKNFAVFNCSF
jgi:4-diphosphocytidyl-2-C-methyl-D-erythritol kinase